MTEPNSIRKQQENVRLPLVKENSNVRNMPAGWTEWAARNPTATVALSSAPLLGLAAMQYPARHMWLQSSMLPKFGLAALPIIGSVAWLVSRSSH